MPQLGGALSAALSDPAIAASLNATLAVSALAHGGGGRPTHGQLPPRAPNLRFDGSLDDDEPADEEFELQLADAPHLEAPRHADQLGASPVQRRRALRDANAVLVRAIAGTTGMTHAQVNGELNRLSGVSRVAEADADALEKRRAAGARWLARVGARGGTNAR